MTSLLLLLVACGGTPEDSGGSVSTSTSTAAGTTTGTLTSTGTSADSDGDGVPDSSDCAPTDETVFPGAPESCDGADQDCDQRVDEDAVNAGTWAPDLDGDGWGDASAAIVTCERPPGYVSGDSDCDDAHAEVHPLAGEICDGLDNDCDGKVDSDDDSVDLSTTATWYPDMDADGYGADAGAVAACDRPDGWSGVGGDCDDTAAGVNPAAVEVCDNGVDDDCTDGVNSCGLAGSYTPASADLALAGDEAGSGWGASVAAGDLTGDGQDDLVVGAPERTVGSSVPGGVGVVPGAVSVGTDANDAAWIDGAEDLDGFGVEVHVVDGDGDGVLDLVVGSAAAHAAWLVLGPVMATGDVAGVGLALSSESPDETGVSVGVGDLDGDGSLDFAVGAPARGSSTGRVWVQPGPVSLSETLSDSVVYRDGQSLQDRCGGAVAVADFDADGVADLLVGATGEDDGGTDAGAAYVELGPISGTFNFLVATAKFTGTGALHKAGAAVAAMDVDGDGADDVLVGAPGAGAAYYLSNPASGSRPLSGSQATLEAPKGAVRAGATVAAAGDLDLDGRGDFTVADPDYDGLAGRAWLVAGVPSGRVDLETGAMAIVAGSVAGDQVGLSAGWAGDLDGDAEPDWLLGQLGSAGVGGVLLYQGGGW